MASAFVQLRRDQLEELRVPLVRACPGVEEVRDAVLERRIGRVRNAVRVQRGQEVGCGLCIPKGGRAAAPVRSRARRVPTRVCPVLVSVPVSIY